MSAARAIAGAALLSLLAIRAPAQARSDLLASPGAGAMPAAVSADGHGGFLAAGHAYRPDIAAQGELEPFGWIVDVDARGQVERACRITSPDGGITLARLRASGSLAIVVGGLGEQAWIAGLSIADLSLAWQVTLAPPLSCAGDAKGCTASAMALDAAWVSADRAVVLLTADIGWKKTPWIVEVDATGHVLRQALLVSSPDWSASDDSRAVAIVAARDGVRIAADDRRSPATAWIAAVRTTEPEWSVTWAREYRMPAGGTATDLAPTHRSESGAATHVLAAIPYGSFPLSETCRTRVGSARETVRRERRALDPPSAMHEDKPLAAYRFWDELGQGAALLGLRDDGGIAWSHGSCAIVDVAVQSVAFDETGHGVLVADVQGRDREMLTASLDADGIVGSAWIPAMPWTHELSREVTSASGGFTVVGQAMRDAEISRGQDNWVRLMRLGADGSPPTGCPAKTVDLQWEPLHAGASSRRVALVATRVVPGAGTVKTVPSYVTIEAECVEAPATPPRVAPDAQHRPERRLRFRRAKLPR